MGLVNTTTITSDGDHPEPHDYKLKLEVDFTLFDHKVDPQLATMLNKVLDYWRDGRRPLWVEFLHEAINKLLREAAYAAIEQRMREKYGNEMVQTGKRSHTSKAYLEAQAEYDRALKAGEIPSTYNTPRAKIERQLSREEIAKALTNDPEQQRILSMTDEELAS